MTDVLGLLAAVALISLLYIFLAAPELFSKKDRIPFLNKRYYAHRGLFDRGAGVPENSMTAFRRAVDLGYGIELDVQLTKDRVPVVFHDADLERMCGVKGKIWEYPFAELETFRLSGSEEKIPSLAEVLCAVDGKVPLIIEYKLDNPSTEVCRIANELLKDYAGLYCIESFHPKALRWYRKNCPDIIRGQLSDDFRGRKGTLVEKLAGLALTYLLTNFWTRPDFIAYNHSYERNFSRRFCRKLGAVSAAYTIKDECQYEKVKDAFDVFIFDSCILK